MKIPPSVWVLFGTCAFAVSAVAQSRPTTSTLASNTEEIPAVQLQQAPTVVSLGLKRNERNRTLTFSIPNDTDQKLKVLGIQTTSGLFVTSFPDAIGARKKGDVVLTYVAIAGASEGVDFVNVLTDHGILRYQVDHDRDPAALLSSKTLTWQQGSTANSQTVMLTLADASAVPIEATATHGHRAAIEKISNTSYQISITPASTERVDEFAVRIKLKPELPGFSALIVCRIVAKQ